MAIIYIKITFRLMVVVFGTANIVSFALQLSMIVVNVYRGFNREFWIRTILLSLILVIVVAIPVVILKLIRSLEGDKMDLNRIPNYTIHRLPPDCGAEAQSKIEKCRSEAYKLYPVKKKDFNTSSKILCCLIQKVLDCETPIIMKCNVVLAKLNKNRTEKMLEKCFDQHKDRNCSENQISPLVRNMLFVMGSAIVAISAIVCCCSIGRNPLKFFNVKIPDRMDYRAKWKNLANVSSKSPEIPKSPRKLVALPKSSDDLIPEKSLVDLWEALGKTTKPIQTLDELRNYPNLGMMAKFWKSKFMERELSRTSIAAKTGSLTEITKDSTSSQATESDDNVLNNSVFYISSN